MSGLVRGRHSSTSPRLASATHLCTPDMEVVMANLLRNKRRSCQCCGDPEFTRGQARRQEQRAWRKEQDETLYPSFHEEEYERTDWDWDGTGSCDASDLEGIPRVYCDMGQELLGWR